MPRGVGLDRDRVLDLAEAIVDEEGADALTLTRLAAAAGVRKPSLYKHVNGLPEITEALVVRAYERLEAALGALEPHDDLRAGLPALAHAWRETAAVHPGLYALSTRTHLAGAPAVAETGQRVLDRLLAHVARWGVEGDDAIHLARSARALVHGFIDLEARAGFGVAVDLDTSFTRAVEALAAGWAEQL
jgi:AcrR family transcriptional regulator